ncbi:MAG: hypothetical protein JRN45_00270 [Nitrososphaerota archaeon]|nr:hypothetical protein [Nitrososphaerota archaeon]
MKKKTADGEEEEKEVITVTCFMGITRSGFSNSVLGVLSENTPFSSFS